jgi:pyruvate/2-oxoglutarate/acetoin dehydrogenase E1 component
MPIKTYREAVKEALAQEMEHDERVVLIGEDLRRSRRKCARRSKDRGFWRCARSH